MTFSKLSRYRELISFSKYSFCLSLLRRFMVGYKVGAPYLGAAKKKRTPTRFGHCYDKNLEK